MSFFIHAVNNAHLQNFIDDGPYWLGLFLTAPDRNGAGGVEPSALEYERQGVVWDTPANSFTTNTATVRFPTPVTSGGYGEIVGMGLFLADTGGTPQALLSPPGGSFTMPQGYDREFLAGYITLEYKE